MSSTQLIVLYYFVKCGYMYTSYQLTNRRAPHVITPSAHQIGDAVVQEGRTNSMTHFT
jgi:hypothetical protein